MILPCLSPPPYFESALRVCLLKLLFQLFQICYFKFAIQSFYQILSKHLLLAAIFVLLRTIHGFMRNKNNEEKLNNVLVI